MSVKSREYDFNKEIYMHGACQYFAIEAAKLYGGKVCLWLDTDYYVNEEGPTKVLCHAYTKIADGLYVDAYGAFRSIKEREEEFEFNEKDIVECSVDRAKEILKELNVSFTNPEMKRNAREFLRNYMLLFKVNWGNNTHYLGLNTRTKIKGLDVLIMNSYNVETGTFGEFLHQFRVDHICKEIKKCLGFYQNPGWYYKH